MDEAREQELRIQVEQETRMAIAKKMQEGGLTLEFIKKYTGITLEEKKEEPTEYDLAAKEVAAEMMMRGVPMDSIAICTRLPRAVLKELRDQLPF